MPIRLFEKKDLEEVNSWRKERGVSPLELDLLPKFGLIKPNVGAGFLFKSDCKLATIGSLSTNKKIDKKERAETLDLIIEMLYQKAIQDGVLLVSIASNIKHLNARYKNLGFLDGDKSVDIFFRRELCH